MRPIAGMIARTAATTRLPTAIHRMDDGLPLSSVMKCVLVIGSSGPPVHLKSSRFSLPGPWSAVRPTNHVALSQPLPSAKAINGQGGGRGARTPRTGRLHLPRPASALRRTDPMLLASAGIFHFELCLRHLSAIALLLPASSFSRTVPFRVRFAQPPGAPGKSGGSHHK